MRAALLTGYGTAPEVGEHPEPAAAAGESVIEVSAAPITPLDLLCASGTSYFGKQPLPYVPGVQGVGRVRSSDTLPAGTRVWFPCAAGQGPGDGSLAELAVAADAELVALDVDVPDTLVAALGLSAVAAWMVLTARGRLRPGERVLVLGAGGVVGQVAVQLARLLGAGAVFGAARSAEAIERAARHCDGGVVPLTDHDEPADLAAAMGEFCGGEVDLVVDPIGGTAASAALRCLAAGGRMVNLGGSASDSVTFSSAQLRSGSRSILGYTNASVTPEQRLDAFGHILEHAARGELSLDHETVPLSGVAAAWRRQAQGSRRRAVVTLP